MDKTQSKIGALGELIAVCISVGGVPKNVVAECALTIDGLVGDAHNHEKHCRPHRAVTIQDVELLDELKEEGYPVGPGVMGENLTVRGLDVQRLSPGDRLSFQGGPTLELTEVRKPCFVLDSIDPQLKDVVVERCGFLAKAVTLGTFTAGQRITVTPGETP